MQISVCSGPMLQVHCLILHCATSTLTHPLHRTPLTPHTSVTHYFHSLANMTTSHWNCSVSNTPTICDPYVRIILSSYFGYRPGSAYSNTVVAVFVSFCMYLPLATRKCNQNIVKWSTRSFTAEKTTRSFFQHSFCISWAQDTPRKKQKSRLIPLVDRNLLLCLQMLYEFCSCISSTKRPIVPKYSQQPDTPLGYAVASKKRKLAKLII